LDHERDLSNTIKKKTKEVAKIANANGGVTYEAETNKNDVLFDTNGNFIKKRKRS
jgi:hypothetical protein